MQGQSTLAASGLDETIDMTVPPSDKQEQTDIARRERDRYHDTADREEGETEYRTTNSRPLLYDESGDSSIRELMF